MAASGFTSERPPVGEAKQTLPELTDHCRPRGERRIPGTPTFQQPAALASLRRRRGGSAMSVNSYAFGPLPGGGTQRTFGIHLV
jgi:hypothetical protein